MNLDELKALFELLEEQGIAEFEIDEEKLKLRIRRGAPSVAHLGVAASATPVVPVVTQGPAAARGVAAASVAAAPAAAAEDDGLYVVKSPIVGTFYRAADPTSAPFVNVGDRVSVGQVLCIIEAMKLMNEIEAEVAGEIVRVHHDSGQPVQYGEPLFALRPDR